MCASLASVACHWTSSSMDQLIVITRLDPSACKRRRPRSSSLYRYWFLSVVPSEDEPAPACSYRAVAVFPRCVGVGVMRTGSQNSYPPGHIVASYWSQGWPCEKSLGTDWNQQFPAFTILVVCTSERCIILVGVWRHKAGRMSRPRMNVHPSGHPSGYIYEYCRLTHFVIGSSLLFVKGSCSVD